MKETKRVVSLLLAAILVMSLLVGCGKSDANKGGNATADGILAEINVGITADPGDLSPFSGGNAGKTQLEWGFLQPLFQCTNGNYYPVIGKEYVIDDDYMGCTVEIFDYVTDSLGNKYTANDFVYMWGVGMGMGKINNVGFVDSVEAKDDYHIYFKFNKSLQVGNLDNLFKIKCVTQAAYDSSEDAMIKHPVGTGQYVLTSWEDGYLLTFEKRDDYWQTDEQYIASNDHANVQKINYYIIPEIAQHTIGMENGSIDFSAFISAEDLPMFAEGGQYEEDFWINQVPDNLSWVLYPNCAEGHVTTDVNLRKAIFYAVDAQTILNSIYDGNGSVNCDISASWGAGMIDSFKNEENYFTAYDVDIAKDYLAKSNYNGETLVLVTGNTSDHTNIAQLIQGFLKAVGIEVKINAVESSMLNTTRENPDNWDLVIDTAATNVYAVTSYNSYNQDTYSWGGSFNFIFDDQLQDLITKAWTMSTYGDASYQALHDYFVENAYSYAMFNYNLNMVCPKYLTNVDLSFKKSVVFAGCTYDLSLKD